MYFGDTDILQLLRHNYTSARYLNVAMDNILKNIGQSKEQEGGHGHLALFEKCHDLFQVPTGTRDRRLNVPYEGRGSEW